LLLLFFVEYEFFVSVPVGFGTKTCRKFLTGKSRVLKAFTFGAKLKL